jgi:hypothetical protein
MKHTEEKITEIHLCHKCNKEIPFGDRYFSIVKSLEFRTYNEEDKQEEIEIVEANEVICICEVCGNYFNIEVLDTILKVLPIPGHENKN